MKKVILLIVISLSVVSVMAQNRTDSVLIVKKAFTQNGVRLTPRQLLQITHYNAEANSYMQKAQSNNVAASIFGFAGGFLIGWPIGTAIVGGEANWAMAGIGAGLVLIGIPFSVGYKRNATKAVEIYNRDLAAPPETTGAVEWKLGFTRSGVGIAMKF
ncbi:MAG: hypothetical protein EOM83_02510 [Clostridia bacterium]|nr:hypothetical protein [Clostridia bacterium]